MTREESLKLLDEACAFMDSMSNEELFDYMFENSQSFRNEIERIEKEITYSNISEYTLTITEKYDESLFSTADSNISSFAEYTVARIFNRKEEMEDLEWLMTQAA